MTDVSVRSTGPGITHLSEFSCRSLPAGNELQAHGRQQQMT